MNYKLVKENPIELLRLKHGMSQEDFSSDLGYPNVNQYAYHKKEFTPDILERIKEKYGIDLTADVISYLKYRLKHGGSMASKTSAQQKKGSPTAPQPSIFAVIN